jgi:hypothetical protein
MQLDIFADSRDVVLRNAAAAALSRRDPDAATKAIATLAAEYGAEPLLPALRLLCQSLSSPLPKTIARETARALLRQLDEEVAPAARAVFGRQAQDWLAPLWVELARAIADFPLDAPDEALHAAPLLLRAQRGSEAVAAIERIASWRRQPAPLAWMIEARASKDGFDAVWPLLAELSWMAPRRAQALAARLGLSVLERLLHGFDAEFEADGGADDFAWFPAWALIAERGLAPGLRLAQTGADTPAERCARNVLGLLLLERQGRQGELVESRKKLREAHPQLFARYMKDR